MSHTKTKIIVGLSGGVDSAVACKLLIDKGYKVEAAFMKNWEEDDTSETCSAEIDLKDAQEVADNLGIKLHTVNFSHEYWERVFKYFLAEYAAGRTPNPDVLCNKEIKFHEFLHFAKDLGADKIATGHYARITESQHVFTLRKGLDTNKDQSYFLHLLNQNQLAQSLFPLGALTKPTIRDIAAKAGFGNAQKKDSTGICFIGEKNFRDFLQNYLPAQAGKMLTPEGIHIGDHIGLMHYTLGQRKGLNIGGHKDYDEAPWYVLAKKLKDNILVVGQDPHHPMLTCATITALTPHWISSPPSSDSCHAKIRYRQADQACTILEHNEASIKVQFDSPQYAATPGQSLVLYREDECLGGAVIHTTE